MWPFCRLVFHLQFHCLTFIVIVIVTAPADDLVTCSSIIVIMTAPADYLVA